ncbi:hypothetical protein OG478_18810 [Streptomyces phaeochromogenes]|uniref:hypothetical protein n=1 Tax=Streptomyces phaeochromogenes TaxID=1923 RepID=UPI0038677EB2|nr:hypothetical protein OG478_18810 [Streptomyces phaeochromogenes]
MPRLRHARWSILLIMTLVAAIQLGSMPAASSHGDHGGEGRIVEPREKMDGLTGRDAMGEGWYRIFSLPAAENPWFENGERCVKLGRTGKVLLAIGNGPSQNCTVKAGTAVYVLGITAVCDEVEEPPYYAVGKAAQRKCAWTALRTEVESVRLTVDGGKSVDLQKRRFGTCAPQRAVQLRPDNFLGVPAQPATFTACGWVAWLTDLAPGRHVLRSEATFTDGSEPHIWAPVINVVRKNHH